MFHATLQPVAAMVVLCWHSHPVSEAFGLTACGPRTVNARNLRGPSAVRHSVSKTMRIICSWIIGFQPDFDSIEQVHEKCRKRRKQAVSPVLWFSFMNWLLRFKLWQVTSLQIERIWWCHAVRLDTCSDHAIAPVIQFWFSLLIPCCYSVQPTSSLTQNRCMSVVLCFRSVKPTFPLVHMPLIRLEIQARSPEMGLLNLECCQLGNRLRLSVVILTKTIKKDLIIRWFHDVTLIHPIPTTQ